MQASQPILVQHAQPDTRPFIHPIVAPDGVGVLTENEPPHHPWQHGLYVGLNDINGIGFWEEGRGGKPTDGTFHPAPLDYSVTSPNSVSWQVKTEWRAPDQVPMITEFQDWSFTDHGDSYVLDLRWTLHALVDLKFGQYNYGGLFLRMPFRHELGGTALNSEGQRDRDGEGQRARWTAVSLPIPERDGSWAGIAIMDHPDNPEHPVPWRVDHQLGIAPSRCIAGAWTLAQNAQVEFRHRVFVYTGRPETDQIEQIWNDFADKASQ